MRKLRNFGRNLTITPKRIVVPADETELIELLRDCAAQKERVRALGSLHSWSGVVDIPDVLVDISGFRRLELHTLGKESVVEAGAGCSVADVLEYLGRHDLTLPTVGAITKQRIPGAIATATHGSGMPSLSDCVRAMRVACVDPRTSEPGMVVFDRETNSEYLDAARVSLGYMGIVTSVSLACVPQYDVEEDLLFTESLREDILEKMHRYPLQQFALFPHGWRYYVFRRRPLARSSRRLRDRLFAFAYRAYKLLVIDFSLHALVKLMARFSKGWLSMKVFGAWLPKIALRNVRIVDRSDRALTLRHDLFRHVEMEAFVPIEHIERALTLVRHLTAVFARGGPSPDDLPEDVRHSLEALSGMMDTLRAARGSFTFHYVISCRFVGAESGLIAMSGGSGDWVSISFFTYRTGGDRAYYHYCRVIAECLSGLCKARLHWGKHFPLRYEEGARRMYPPERLDAFRAACRRFDPEGMFRNDYAREVLGFED